MLVYGKQEKENHSFILKYTAGGEREGDKENTFCVCIYTMHSMDIYLSLHCFSLLKDYHTVDRNKHTLEGAG